MERNGGGCEELVERGGRCSSICVVPSGVPFVWRASTPGAAEGVIAGARVSSGAVVGGWWQVQWLLLVVGIGCVLLPCFTTSQCFFCACEWFGKGVEWGLERGWWRWWWLCGGVGQGSSSSRRGEWVGCTLCHRLHRAQSVQVGLDGHCPLKKGLPLFYSKNV